LVESFWLSLEIVPASFLAYRRILLLEFRFLACLMQLSKNRCQSSGP